MVSGRIKPRMFQRAGGAKASLRGWRDERLWRGGGEKLRGFFTELGAPGDRGRGEKPG
jgi:hypothetical protein